MAGRWPLIVGITTVAAVVAWFALRDRTADPPRPVADGSAGLTASNSPASAPPSPRDPTSGSGVGTGPKPELPPAPPAPPAATTPAAVFEAEPRDDAWAPPTEGELRRRFQKVRGAKLDGAECRDSQCRLVIVGSEAQVTQTIADLEGNRGLHGFASTLMLTAPEQKPDGTIVLRAYAKFDRGR